MVAVPDATPVIVPLETVAMLVFEEVQAPPETVEVKVVVDPAQTVCVPDKVPAEVPLLASSMVEVPVTAIGLVVVLEVPENDPMALPKANEYNLVLFEEPVYPNRYSNSCIGSA
jgi:hypothetical protein